MLAFLVLYGLTLCRTVYWYDSAELVTAAVVLGIPHPPGYPLYTLIGHVFTWLPVSPALAVNAMSAVFGALSVGLVYRIARRLGAGPIAAVVGSTTFGASWLFWANSVVAEVYTPGLFFTLSVWLLLLHAREGGRPLWLIAAGFVAGLGLGVHMSIATLGLGFAFMVVALGGVPREGDSFWQRADLMTRTKVALGAGMATLAGACIYLYLPWRAAMKPRLNFADVSDPDRFIWLITGGNYKSWFIQEESFADRVHYFASTFESQLTAIGLLLAAVGLAWLIRRSRLDAAAIVLMVAGNLYWFFWYGVHDVEVFVLPTTAIFAVLIALGVQSVGVNAAGIAERHGLPGLPLLTQGVLCMLPIAMIAANYSIVDMSETREADDFVHEAIARLPEGALIVNYTTPPEWKLDAVFGMYTRIVLGERPDVRVMTTPSPEFIADLLMRGHDVYAYYPVDVLRGHFTMKLDGPLLRLSEPSTELVERVETVREAHRVADEGKSS